MTIDTLPTDPFILLSFINTRLRDRYSSLDALCDDMNVSRSDIEARIGAVGYVYDSTLNKFI